MISKNMVQRIIVAIVFIPLIIFLVFYGGILFPYFVMLLAALSCYEYFKGGGLRWFDPLFLIPSLSILAIIYFTSAGQPGVAGAILLGVFLITGILVAVGNNDVKSLFDRLKYVIWGVIYIGLLFPFIYLVRGEAAWMEPSPGRWWLFLLLATIWLCDTAAQFFGYRFGRHKLAPTVSPNKTIEGFIGGFLGAVLAALVFRIFWLKSIGFVHLLALAILISLFGQLGDLVESLWKRSVGIKDSSSIIPGHGGVLDRFDSLIFAAPVVYFYLKLILQAPWL